MSEIDGVRAELEERIARGELRADPLQMECADLLDDLLRGIRDNPPRRKGWFRPTYIAPKGLYIWGGVGRGKSMLMDWFFDKAEIKTKQRVHFHAFMLRVHARIDRWRKMSADERRHSEDYVRGAGDDPIAPTAKAIAREGLLLCFDEFHVTDITDAMILSRLFEALWKRGMIVVATSNRVPDDLYKNGLNRQLFTPFIDLMKTHLKVWEFGGETDHRLRKLGELKVYYTPLGPEADQGVEAAWQRLIGPMVPRKTCLTVQGRELSLQRVAAGTARASFKRLCEQPLGAADYLRLAQAFHTLIIENVPQMGPDMRNEAKRFVTLIDALYETRTKLIMSAAVEPAKLYVDGTGAFEFERTASRLSEMQSKAYIEAARQIDVAQIDATQIDVETNK